MGDGTLARSYGKENLKDAGDVELVHARLENMQLPRESYEAVFSASAIHWVDPDLSLGDRRDLAHLPRSRLHDCGRAGAPWERRRRLGLAGELRHRT